MKTAIVIPTYNEAENIVDLLNELGTFGARIIIVDDSSPDGTADLASEKATVIKRENKSGLGSAYVEGFRKALDLDAETIVQMDADFSHSAKDLARMLKLVAHGDLIIGSRYMPGGKIKGWGPWRHVCSRSAMFVSRHFLKLPVRDVTSGFRIWRAPLLSKILEKPIASSGYAFQEEMLFHAWKAGARIVETPIVFRDRVKGRSKLGHADVKEFFQVLLYLRRQKN